MTRLTHENRLAPVLLTLALCAGVAVVAAACSDEPDMTLTSTLPPDCAQQPIPTPSPSIGGPAADAAAADTEPIVEIDFPAWVDETPKAASLIAESDVIARAKFSSYDYALDTSHDYGTSIAARYTFDIIEYLKGCGADQMIVRRNDGPISSMFTDAVMGFTEEEARGLGEHWKRQTQSRLANGGDAILFLQGPHDGRYFFTVVSVDYTRGRQGPFEYSLLVEDTPSNYRVLTRIWQSSTLRRGYLRTSIAELMPSLEGEYERCAIDALRWRNRVKDQILGEYRQLVVGGSLADPEPFTRSEVELNGEARAMDHVVRLSGGPFPASRISDFWLAGRDKDLFEFEIISDGASANGELRAAGPLPTGQYSVHFGSSHQSLHCNYHDPESWIEWDVTEWVINVTAPARTLHEAFFDPVAIDTAVGADATNGALEPASFAIDDTTTTTLDSIAWESRRATIKVSPNAVPANNHVDFIALDGTVAVRLDVDDATKSVNGDDTTLTWGVCIQPWKAGDLLMLRISKSPADLTGATNDLACDGTP